MPSFHISRAGRSRALSKFPADAHVLVTAKTSPSYEELPFIYIFIFAAPSFCAATLLQQPCRVSYALQHFIEFLLTLFRASAPFSHIIDIFYTGADIWLAAARIFASTSCFVIGFHIRLPAYTFWPPRRE